MKLIKVLAITGWFIVLTGFNIVMHLAENADKNIEYIVLEAIGRLTSPIEFAVSAAVVSGIALAGRKPMAER